MAKWFKEHLGFKTTKAPPPAPPKPDYRHCHTGVPAGAPGYLQQQPSSGATFPSPAQPDILAAYKLQKELDFEDPYTPGGNISFGHRAAWTVLWWWGRRISSMCRQNTDLSRWKLSRRAARLRAAVSPSHRRSLSGALSLPLHLRWSTTTRRRWVKFVPKHQL